MATTTTMTTATPPSSSSSLQELSNFEAETEYFGIDPVTIVDAVINAVNNIAFSTAEELCEHLATQDSHKEKGTSPLHSSVLSKYNKYELRKAINSLLEFVQDNIDKYFDKFELYCLQYILRVPTNVRLSSDISHVWKDVSEEDVRSIDVEIDDLRKEVKAAHYIHQSLDGKIKKLESFVANLESNAKRRVQVKKLCEKANVPFMNENIRHAVDQISRLVDVAVNHFPRAKRSSSDFDAHDDGDAKRVKIEKLSKALGH